MRTAFRTSFTRDLKNVKDKRVLDQVAAIIESVELAGDLREVGDLKKMAGTANLYRLRIGEYRIGIAVTEGVIEFVRCLPRKDLYRYFP